METLQDSNIGDVSAVDLFRALADPTRFRILALLRTIELSVGELAQLLGQSQPRVSRHLRILVEAGLMLRRREGSWIFLAPAPRATSLFALIDAMATPADHAVLESDAARLAAIRTERSAAAERYFAAHAEQWDAIRSLHVPEDEVEARMRALFSRPLGRFVDIGTGTGRMIELFGEQASRSLGIDRSPEMLRLARARLNDRFDAKPNILWELRQGDVTALPIAEDSVDHATLHQILHFIPSPDLAIAEVARILAPGGTAMIVDFDAHDQEALRTGAAHARLGFSDAQLAEWGAGHGLALTHIEALGGDPLTVKLWLLSKSPLGSLSSAPKPSPAKETAA